MFSMIYFVIVSFHFSFFFLDELSFLINLIDNAQYLARYLLTALIIKRLSVFTIFTFVQLSWKEEIKIYYEDNNDLWSLNLVFIVVIQNVIELVASWKYFLSFYGFYGSINLSFVTIVKNNKNHWTLNVLPSFNVTWTSTEALLCFRMFLTNVLGSSFHHDSKYKS